MQEFLDRFREIEAEVAREKGGFNLFALLLREDGYGKWDLVVAAPWIGERRLKTLEYLAGKITPRLSLQELLSLAMIVPVSSHDEPVRRLIQEFPVSPDQPPVEIRDWDYDGMPIARGYILTARPAPEASATSNAAAAGREEAVVTGR